MLSSPTILIPTQLPAVACMRGNTHLLKMACVFLAIKALYPEGRFKWCKAELWKVAELTRYTSLKGLENWLVRLEEKGLAQRKKDGCYYIGTWKQFLEVYNLPRKRYYEIQLADNQSLDNVLFEKFWEQEEAYFEKCQEYNIEHDAIVQDTLTSVFGDPHKLWWIHQGQLDLFCNIPPGTIDNEHEWLLLYASKKGRKFYFKADTHISVQHLSTRMGYKHKNGFCYRKKKLQQQGLITVRRREFEVKKSFRTNGVARDTGIGTFFVESSSRTQKLRMVDEVKFLRPGLSNAGASGDSSGTQAQTLKKVAA